jgi:hypothetical protein
VSDPDDYPARLITRFPCTMCGSRDWPRKDSPCPLCSMDDDDDIGEDEETETEPTAP